MDDLESAPLWAKLGVLGTVVAVSRTGVWLLLRRSPLEGVVLGLATGLGATIGFHGMSDDV